ncbi:hypothetical protein O181_063644 [Austropuccinia psidii MF-1]|uniref:Uncharacterized protein n=1 Tax=Austropuccinia psidii MF-1 TaxID=1389203 RepID=A0A9Q3I2R7_9BASI|nr:hypothetical protein [Austropuccinia psidii MF-1]
MTPKADLSNGLTQAHAAFTCHTAARPFVQTLSPGHKAATNACDACQQAHKKCLFVVHPFGPCGQRSSQPRRPYKDSFLVDNDKSIPMQEWTPGPQTGRQEQFRTISPVPSSIDLSTPPPMVTSLLDRSKVIIRPMKDGDGKRTFKLGLIVTHGIQMPNLPHKQTPRQPTPGPSGTQWSEDLFFHKQPKFHLISTLDSSVLTVPPFVEPYQTEEPPIPGTSPL